MGLRGPVARITECHPERKHWALGMCKPCYGASSHRKAIDRKSNYGIEQEEYDLLMKMQNGKCYICRGVNASGKALAVDHDADTSGVRMLLCSKCNIGLGNFNHNPELLRKAAEYMDKMGTGLILREAFQQAGFERVTFSRGDKPS